MLSAKWGVQIAGMILGHAPGDSLFFIFSRGIPLCCKCHDSFCDKDGPAGQKCYCQQAFFFVCCDQRHCKSHTAEITLAVADRIAGKVIAARHA